MFFINLYWMPSQMFMLLDDAVMVAILPYSNVLYRPYGPYD